MTIEDTLLSIDTTLKALLASAQSGAQMAATTETAGEATARRKRRTKEEIAADEAAEATAKQAAGAALTQAAAPATDAPRYWVNSVDGSVYAQLAGMADPTDMNFKIETHAYYLEKLAAAKNAQPAATAPATASTAPSATAQPATASAATSGATTWDDAVSALKALAMNPAHGNTAVLAVIKQIDPAAANVPALKALGKNAEIVAAVNTLLNPAAGADPLFG